MTKNEQLNEDLYGYNFEVYRTDYKYVDSEKPTLTEKVIGEFESIEDAFEKVDQTYQKIGQLRRKKDSKVVIVYETSDFGTTVIENGIVVSSVLIREIKKQKVS